MKQSQHERGRSARRAVATVLSPLVATAGIVCIAGTAEAAVTIGSNISVFPNRDMVVAVGYTEGEDLTVEVERNGVVIGTAKGPAVETPEGIGLEVNHGPLGSPLPGDCWNGYTPDIVGGDVIRVTPTGSATSDSMTVADVAFTGNPVLEADGSVSVQGTATPSLDFAVEFRRDKPDPRFRRGPFVPVFDPANPGSWKATFRPTATSAEGLTAQQQRDIALNEASWLAVADDITETTLAELGEPGGVGPGCTGSADPNNIGGGLEPINAATTGRTISGTAREGVAAVSVTVGSSVKDATLSTNATGVKTWTVDLTAAEVGALPQGTVTVTPTFDGLAGASRTILKDTQLPGLPVPSPEPGIFPSGQKVTLTTPAGEPRSKIYYTIGGAAVRNPEEGPNDLYAPMTQIDVTATQTIKAMVIDAAGNPGAVGSFTYTIGAVNEAPIVQSESPASGATGVAVGSNVTATFNEAVAGVNGTTFTLRAAGSTTNIPAAVGYNGTTRVATLKPGADLAPNTQYTVTLTGGATAIRDTGSPAAALETTSWSFTTAAPATNPPPTVSGRTPAVNATGVAVGNNITATFNEAVTGVSGTTFTLRAAGATTDVGATVSYNTTTRVATLDPTATLAAGTQYTATLTGGTAAIRDLAGAPLTTNGWTFTTAAAVNPAPTVTARAPGLNTTSVGLAANITATFSEPVNGVSGTTFQVRNAAGALVAAPAPTRNGTTNQWILNPTNNLVADTRYTVTLTSGSTAIRDLAGAPLTGTTAQPLTWSFTTGPAPTVSARTPAAGATGVSRTANVTATFSEAVAGVGTGTFVLRSPAGAAITATVTRNGTTNQWILNPSATLVANTRYTVTLDGGGAAIRDNAGNPLVDATWAFTTGAA